MTRTLDQIRAALRADLVPDEGAVLGRLVGGLDLAAERRAAISGHAARLVEAVRAAGAPGVMESFLAEYGLSTREGVALMCLAEALLRVPDTATIDALIEDKIAPADWGRHLGRSASSLVNASTWALMLTGQVLGEGEGLIGALRGAVRRLGEPVIRTAVAQAMKELGRQFVLGRTIEEAMRRAEPMQARGYTYSYDMLGEAARTEGDARHYMLAYSDAISALAAACVHADIRANPGISVKLSALHPRYEVAQAAQVHSELVSRTRALAALARSAGMGFNIDAEEADRLDLSLDVIEAVLSDPGLAGWDGFGVVVQAYGPRAGHVIDWLYALSGRLGRRIMVRLVKGAYWDAEIKRAQVLGLDGYPVFTRKVGTDVSYIANAARLLGMTDRIYPQFATHNAHTVAAVLELAGDRNRFEFQRLHGMGEALHDAVLTEAGTRCRIYAPVGAHRDLLAYLVRRLLENGANSSFVNQIVDKSIPAAVIARDPLDVLAKLGGAVANPGIARPPALYPGRINAQGWDLADPLTLAALEAARGPWRAAQWMAAPILAVPPTATPSVLRDDASDAADRFGSPQGGGEQAAPVANPARPGDIVGHVVEAGPDDVAAALAAAAPWGAPVAERAAALIRAAELYEAAAPEIFALLAREAGKTLGDAVSELREAVDFLRYYAAGARADAPRGVVVCISPWNFPLAIFTGQIAAALVCGNAVLAKPAEQTPLIAALAVRLMHQAGVPPAALQLLPGQGATVGAALTRDPRVAAVAFTGGTDTARAIDRAMAEHLDPAARLVAETGGLNAMIVDSTALPEQAVRDILASAFQSAGQRCSALRVLYLQEDVADRVLTMLMGAMDELVIGDPWDLATDIGPVIDADAKAMIEAHIAQAQAEGRVLKRLAAPGDGLFVAPTVLRIGGIGDLAREVFGPVLHVARYAADQIDDVVAAINATGFGLTFGLHSRIDDRVAQVLGRIRAGNVYVNRNQIGAVVGVQPFGGEGLSGTGPKAGGPGYLAAFCAEPVAADAAPGGAVIAEAALAAALSALTLPDWTAEPVSLPGPTGESNRLSVHPRGRVLCLGPSVAQAMAQAEVARATGNAALIVAPGATGAAALDGVVDPGALVRLADLAAVALAGGPQARAIRQALAARPGPIVPLIPGLDPARFQIERHVCIDTTAAGGNATLLAQAVAD